MEDEYKYTAPLDDTIPLESPIIESLSWSLDTNAEGVDICAIVQDSVDQMEDYCEKEVVLDSDDEREKQKEFINKVNGECWRVIGKFSGTDAAGLVKKQKVPAGYFRRLGNKFSENIHLNSTRIARCDEESNDENTSLDNDTKHPDQPFVLDSVISCAQDRETFPFDAKELHMDQKKPNIVREKLTEDSLNEKRLFLPKSKTMDIEKVVNYDCEHAKLTYIESPEPAELLGEALQFVDHYLAVGDLGSSKEIETRKTNRIKSPPSLRSKGSQSLAKRVNLGCATTKSIAFDWAEKQPVKSQYTSLQNTKDLICGSEGDKSGKLSMNQESDIFNFQKEKISSFHSNEKLTGNVLSSNKLETDSSNSNENDKVGSNSGIGSARDFIRDLDEQIDADSLRQNVEKYEQARVSADTFDVGLDTQMAAEAMEALIYAAPPMFSTCFAYQNSDNRFIDSSKSVKQKSKSKNFVNSGEVLIGWKNKEKRSKCVKISTVELNKNITRLTAEKFKNWGETAAQLLSQKNLMSQKLLTGNDLNCRTRGNTKNSKCARSSRIVLQQLEKFTERDDLKEVQKDHCLSESNACSPDGQVPESNGLIKSDAPLKRRKMNCHDADVFKMGVRGCLRSNSHSSFQVTTNAAKTEESFNLAVADSSLSKLNSWIYPKGKRARQCVPPHSNRSTKKYSQCVAIHENNAEKCPIINEESHDRVARLLVYSRRRQFSSERKHSGDYLNLSGDSSSPSVNDNKYSDKQIQIPFEFNPAKSPKQFSKLGDEKFSPSAESSGNTKLDVLPNSNSKIFQVRERGGKTNQPYHLPSRSPLMKELTRLGYSDSLPDFLPKHLRRRSQRLMEKVCILFSQNLDINVQKRQKKIVARLGFSIATCSSDATHFIADRFVRTRNMLEAIALGKPIVTHLWLESCEQAGYVIDEKSYILRDNKKEKEIGFSMPETLTRATQHPLLKGYRVFITPNIKPGVDLIHCLVKAVHGQAVQDIQSAKTKDEVIPDDLLIISCEEDYTVCVPYLEKGTSIYDSELLLNGIVIQKLEYDRHQLFKDF